MIGQVAFEAAGFKETAISSLKKAPTKEEDSTGSQKNARYSVTDISLLISRMALWTHVSIRDSRENFGN